MSTPSDAVSSRYVFFKTLTEHDWLYNYIDDASTRLYHVSSAIGTGTAYNARTEEYTDRRGKYLNFIKSMKENLESN